MRHVMTALVSGLLLIGLSACGTADTGKDDVSVQVDEQDNPGPDLVYDCPLVKGDGARYAQLDATINPAVKGAPSVEEAVDVALRDHFGERPPVSGQEFTRITESEGGSIVMSMFDTTDRPVISMIVRQGLTGGWVVPTQMFCTDLSSLGATE